MRHEISPRRIQARDNRGNPKSGVYYRETPKGRRYEISFTDSDGRRRWKTIDGGLREAEAAREELRRKRRRGERIAPSRVPTFREFAATWLDSQSQLRPRTIEKYDGAIRLHLTPRLGNVKVSEIREDDLVALIAAMRAEGKAGWTIQGALVPLGRILNAAVRRGLLASNPLHRLEREERPRVGGRERRILERDEIAKLLDAATPKYRPLLATAVFAGLRLSELLGLVWADVDFDARLLRVRRQLGPGGTRVEPKTERAKREVVLMPALVQVLREHRLASRFKGDDDFVFVSEAGTALTPRNVTRRGFEPAAERAGINVPEREPRSKGQRRSTTNPDGRPRATLHDLRRTFGSLLIEQGEDVVYVSRQMGHANTSITLNVYADLFDRRRHAEEARNRMEAAFGSILAR